MTVRDLRTQSSLPSLFSEEATKSVQDGPCHSASGDALVSWNGFFALLVQAMEANRDFLSLGFSISTLTPFDTEAKHD